MFRSYSQTDPRKISYISLVFWITSCWRIRRHNKRDIPFTFTKILWRLMPTLLEARQKYSPESSSEIFAIWRALLKFSNLILPDGRSPPFLCHMISGDGLKETKKKKKSKRFKHLMLRLFQHELCIIKKFSGNLLLILRVEFSVSSQNNCSLKMPAKQLERQESRN